MENQQAPVMSVKDWLITTLICAIPFVGFVMLFVWAFGGGTHPCKKNWAIATLIWYAIGIVLAIIFIIVFASIFASMFGGMKTYS